MFCFSEGLGGGVTLEKVLIFVSGLSKVPVLGFPVQPTLNFSHCPDKPLPQANTCVISLTLPTMHQTYEDFTHWMEMGILQAPTFGVA